MHTKQQTILIVDDIPANIRLLNSFLEQKHHVLFATTGQKSLELAASQKPDLILLDVVLPDMDGYEVCRRLKADPDTRSIPVIFITALSQEADEERGLQVGGIDYITKPFSPAIVQARVHNHLELKRYRDLLESLSSTDGLTGVPNRRQFDDFLGREWRRAALNRQPLSLILMDIDFFKAYNDFYGHLAGDSCLRQLAKTLLESLQRPSDLLARYGGEEFACVLPETDAPGGMTVALRLQAEVNALQIPHAQSPVAAYVTMSFGVASMLPDQTMPMTELIRLADQQLYRAKNQGRNQVR